MFWPIHKLGCYATALALLLAPKVAAQPRQIQTVLWDFSLEPTPARRGEMITVHLSASPRGQWYIYSHTLVKGKGPHPTDFRFDLPAGLQLLGTIEAPTPKKKFDKGFEMEVEYYREPVVFRQRILIGDDATTGQLQIKGTVHFQSCDDTRCMLPKDLPFGIALTVENGPARGAYRAPASSAIARATTETATSEQPTSPPLVGEGKGAPGPISPTPSAVEKAIQSGLLAFLLLAIVQGFLALTTPCVYPMIPITVSFFLKQGEREGRRPVLLATSYAASIIVTFTSVGLLLTLVYGPAGTTRLATSPIANLVLALFFIAFALSLFGLYEIQVPAAIQNYFSSKGRSGGYSGTVFMGVAFTLASLACTAPFIGALLGLAATGKWFWPLVGMLAFSFAFSLPFFLLALFPQFLARMPKSGGWLNSVKVVMGFLVLAVSLKFLANADVVWNWQVFTRPVILASWTMLAAFAGFYLLGIIRLPHDTPLEHVGIRRMLLSMAFLVLGLYLGAGLFGHKISGTLDAFLPADVDEASGTALGAGRGPSLLWIEDFGQALGEAKAANKPILIDFTGVTCTNCKWMERNIFARREVAQSLSRFVLARLHTDTGPNWRENEKMQFERFGTVTLPFYAIVSPEGRELGRFDGLTRDPARFMVFLDAGISKFETGGN